MASAAERVLLRRAHGMGDNQLFMPTALSFRPRKSVRRAIYITTMREVMLNDRINKIKYQKFTKDAVIMAKFRWVRILHNCPKLKRRHFMFCFGVIFF